MIERRTPLRRSDPAKVRAWRARGARNYARSRGRTPDEQAFYEAEWAAVLVRSGGLCEVRFSPSCENRGTHPHHVWPQRKGRDDRRENLLASCWPCNTQVESDPAGARKRGLLR